MGNERSRFGPAPLTEEDVEAMRVDADTFFATSFTDPPDEADALTLEKLTELMGQIKDSAPAAARIEGRKKDVYDLLITMGCRIDHEAEDEYPVPLPVTLGAIGPDVVFTDEVPTNMVLERGHDDEVLATYIRDGEGWKVFRPDGLTMEYRR